ncbi:hypothetical protein PFFVO_01910 [Plasmodium falciparum Vietnam Oak-Knoll (FVO)]|uniref:Surface antigen n=1 Tax=Plasmodium falciparum Vietnam Oak-Knoll (FVO) TaxID=1036723 RepID=A0A024VAV5_PLAFA|nr:hypothetical protein PFFVO_01910 [Plasmodium falciparum Vietnam Oak-Knoll (FVO)]
MKVHYINILLFAVPLNILVNTHKNPSITPRHIQTTRLLCECELYAPSNYENVPEMKEIMENFNHKTSERFKEYYERMHDKRQKCKEQYEQDIKKIILKDKIEKELAEKLAALETNIDINDIPTCPEMKEIMENFNHKTSERFKEYYERMHDKRQKCKEQYEQDIKKIILKDKIEKELAEKLAALETNIDINDIPTCICEKSMADKTEKFCFKCGRNLGGIAPWWGLVNGILYAGWINYTNTTLVKIATDAGIAEAVKVGLVKVAEIVKQIYSPSSRIPLIDGTKLISAGKFTEKISLYDIGKTIDSTMAIKLEAEGYSDYCFTLQSVVKPNMLKTFPQHAAAIETAFNEAQTGVLTEGASTTSSLTTAITTSIVAIVIIILVVIIIYLILRYRRKKKMKKKLQYIKLLKE